MRTVKRAWNAMNEFLWDTYIEVEFNPFTLMVILAVIASALIFVGRSCAA